MLTDVAEVADRAMTTTAAPHPATASVLLFVAVGDRSPLRWLSTARAVGCAVVVAYYGANAARYMALRGAASVAFAARGSKFQLLWGWLTQQPLGALARWTLVGVLDDDLEWDGDTLWSAVSNMGAHAARCRGDGAGPAAAAYSPAHAPTGRVSHAIMRPHGVGAHVGCTSLGAQPGDGPFRRVTFLEMSWPFFAGDFLEGFLREHYNPAVQGWGVDTWFCALAAAAGRPLFVLDAVPARNPPPEEKGALLDASGRHLIADPTSGEMATVFPKRRAHWEVEALARGLPLTPVGAAHDADSCCCCALGQTKGCMIVPSTTPRKQ